MLQTVGDLRARTCLYARAAGEDRGRKSSHQGGLGKAVTASKVTENETICYDGLNCVLPPRPPKYVAVLTNPANVTLFGNRGHHRCSQLG